MKKFLHFSMVFAMLMMCAQAFASATINIDDASKAQVMSSSTYSYLSLSNGENTVDAGSYQVSPADYSYRLYKVEKNGEELTANWGYYSLTLADGDVLTITASYPASTYKFTVTGPEGIVSSATVNNTKVADPTNFDAEAGYEVVLNINYNNFDVTSVKVNGADPENYYEGSPLYIYATQDVAVAVEGTQKELTTVTVDNASKVYLSNSDTYSSVDLVDGENQVAVGSYSVSAKSYYYTINKVELNGEAVTPNTYGQYKVTLAKDDKLAITADYDPATSEVTFTADEGIVKSIYVGSTSVDPAPSITMENGYKVTVRLDTSSKNIDKITVNGEEVTLSYGSFSFTVKENTAIVITSSEKASAKVVVDDATKVTMYNTSAYTTVTLNNGENIVGEGSYRVNSSNYSYYLNKVELNGEAATASGSSWYIDLKADDVLTITANYDADKYKVTIDAEDGVLQSVTSNYNSVGDFTQPFDALAGYNLTMRFNTSDYAITGITVNGEPLTSYYSGSTSASFPVKCETKVVISTEKKMPKQITINVDDPSTIEVYGAKNSYGYLYMDSSAKLEIGENGATTVPADYSNICIKKATGCYIKSVTADGVAQSADDDGYYYVAITDGTVVDVASAVVIKDQSATLIIKDIDKALYGAYLQSAGREDYMIQEGEQTVKFGEGDNPFTFAAYSDALPNMVVYVNGETQSPMYEGGTAYRFDFPNKGLIEIYIDGGETTYVTNSAAYAQTEDGTVGALTVNFVDYKTSFIDLHADLSKIQVVDANGEEAAHVTAIDSDNYQLDTYACDTTVMVLDKIVAAGEYTLVIPAGMVVMGEGVNVEFNYEPFNIPLSVSASPAKLVRKDNNADGINAVNGNDNANAELYNIAGQRVNATAKGVVIKDGKKFMNK